MRTVLSEPALARTKILRALVRCRRVADPARPPKRHLAHLRYNFLYWSSSPGHRSGQIPSAAGGEEVQR